MYVLLFWAKPFLTYFINLPLFLFVLPSWCSNAHRRKNLTFVLERCWFTLRFSVQFHGKAWKIHKNSLCLTGSPAVFDTAFWVTIRKISNLATLWYFTVTKATFRMRLIFVNCITADLRIKLGAFLLLKARWIALKPVRWTGYSTGR